MIMGQSSTRVDIPHEPGEWMELRDALAPGHLERAAQPVALQRMGIRAEMLKRMGPDNMGILVDSYRRGVSVQEAARQKLLDQGDQPSEVLPGRGEQPSGVLPEAPVPKPLVAPLDEERGQYDMDVLSFCLVRDWSYRDENRRGEPVPAPVTQDRVSALDHRTRSWLHDRAWAATATARADMTEGNS